MADTQPTDATPFDAASWSEQYIAWITVDPASERRALTNLIDQAYRRGRADLLAGRMAVRP